MYIALEAAVMAVERRGQLVLMTYFSQPGAIVYRCSRDDETYEIKITTVIEQEEPYDGRLCAVVRIEKFLTESGKVQDK